VLPQFQPGVLTGSIMPRTGFTPYLRFGNWPVLALIYLGLAVGFAGWRIRRGDEG
jgi:apolipoprotein N-acyltransferase